MRLRPDYKYKQLQPEDILRPDPNDFEHFFENIMDDCYGGMSEEPYDDVGALVRHTLALGLSRGEILVTDDFDRIVKILMAYADDIINNDFYGIKDEE